VDGALPLQEAGRHGHVGGSSNLQAQNDGRTPPMQDNLPAASAEPRTLLLNDRDNVIVAVDGLAPGAVARGVTASSRIPRGHKMAIAKIAKGEPVLKFGQIIGFATEDIAPGEHVHTQNCGFAAFERDYAFCQDAKPEPLLPPEARATFQGFRRSNGRAGTRNYIGIISSVNCSATVVRFIAEEVKRSGLLDDYPTIDGVIPLVHGTGCGIDYNGETFEILKRTTWGYACNPNMAGVLVVGLGCEGFQIARMKEAYGITESDTFRTMTIQETGGTKKTIEAGVDAIRSMLPIAAKARRETIPASELMVALQCGGSDGYSGITANAALGLATDILVRHGGTGVLAETPEIYGAEHLLTRRAATREVGEKLVEIIQWWEDYTARARMSMDNNPSPGNKAGGLTTILEKSLGAAAKGGSTTLNAVYRYAEPITAKGFVFMDTPGYDPVSATGQVAGGCNIVCFTTGRGSAYGCKPSPSIKLATNSTVYHHMIDDMDINCGDILDGVPLEAKAQEIFETILRVASGERSKSELLGYGDAEYVPWQIGATM
jgi:altronate hydrolase